MLALKRRLSDAALKKLAVSFGHAQSLGDRGGGRLEGPTIAVTVSLHKVSKIGIAIGRAEALDPLATTSGGTRVIAHQAREVEVNTGRHTLVPIRGEPRAAFTHLGK